MTAPLHFRIATIDDRDAIIALVTSAYRGDASRAGWTTEADLLDGPRIAPEVLEHDLTRPRSLVLIAERDEVPEPAGIHEPGTLAAVRRMLACAHVCDDTGTGYFGMFAVEPTRQGGGLGDAVLRECERIARDEWRLPRMRMTVLDCRAELLAWYERRGYRRTGVLKPFPYGDARFGLPKRDDLRFEVMEKAHAEIGEEKTYTYAELHAEVQRMAAVLQRLGVAALLAQRDEFVATAERLLGDR